MDTSVPQMEAASTRISTSPGPGEGTGRSTSSAPGSACSFRRARMTRGFYPRRPLSRSVRRPVCCGGPTTRLRPRETFDVTDDAARAATDLADRFWERLLELDPLIGTYVGDERFDDRLPDPSDAGLAERGAAFESALAGLAGIDRTSLDTDLRTTLDVLETGSLRAL